MGARAARGNCIKIISALLISSFLVLGSLSAQTARAQVDEFTHTLLVWKASFTATQLNALKSTGYTRHDQPVKMTSEDLPRNTDFFRLSVTTRTDAENTRLVSNIGLGRVQIMETLKIISAYDSRVGGFVNRSNVRKFMGMPAHYDRDWATYTSSQ